MTPFGKVGQVLQPGQPGTRPFLRQHGPDLVAVRYRCDPDRQRRLTTVELIVDQGPCCHPAQDLVFLRIRFHEAKIRANLKHAGATWNPKARRWITTRSIANSLHLSTRIEPIPPPRKISTSRERPLHSEKPPQIQRHRRDQQEGHNKLFAQEKRVFHGVCRA